MILVDTSCWIQYFHPGGNARVKECLSVEIGQGAVATCGPVLCELFRGVSVQEARRLATVFSGLVTIPTVDGDWLAVQDLALGLKSQGLQPPILDMLVAVVCKRSGAILWHFGDQHFRIIEKELRLGTEDLSRPGNKGNKRP